MYEDYIVKRITQLRLAKGVTAREMSLALGQKENYINQVENGKIVPYLQALLHICEYFNITPKDFFDEDNTNPELLTKLSNTLMKVKESDLIHILGLAESLAENRHD